MKPYAHNICGDRRYGLRCTLPAGHIGRCAAMTTHTIEEWHGAHTPGYKPPKPMPPAKPQKPMKSVVEVEA